MLPDVTALLGDARLSWTERRTRLQGWSGPDAEQADAIAGAQRIAPAVCAAGALAGAVTGSALLLAAFAASALVGAFAANHPFEWLYNQAVHDKRRLPANRAAKRLGCLMGVAFLGGAATANAAGVPTLGFVLAVALGAVAAFVAATGICVPSILFTIAWGAQRGAAPSLAAAMAMDPGQGSSWSGASRPERRAVPR